MFSISQTRSQLLKMKPKPIILIIHFSVNGNLLKSGSFPNCEEEAECLCSSYRFSPHDSPTGKWVQKMDVDRCHSWAAQYWASPPSDEYWWSINDMKHFNNLTLTWQPIFQESEWPNSSRRFNTWGRGCGMRVPPCPSWHLFENKEPGRQERARRDPEPML